MNAFSFPFLLVDTFESFAELRIQPNHANSLVILLFICCMDDSSDDDDY